MNVRTPLMLLATAVLGAAALTALHGNEPLAERVVRLETERVFPEAADELARYSPEVRLVLLDYADDEELVLNARLALLRHPQTAPRVLTLYGAAEPFREILRRHGPAVVPPIHYFLEHDLLGVRLRALLADTPAAPGSDVAAAGSRAVDRDTVAPEVRGQYAIHFIAEEGHDFLGQFVTDEAGEITRVQSERFATGTKRLFTSGLTALETKWRRGDDLTVGDFGWATVDLAVPVVAFKLARAGKLAGHSARSARASARLARAGAGTARVGRTLAIAGSAAGIGYLAMNPGVLNSIGAEIAAGLGLPAWLVTGALWLVLLLPVLILLRLGHRWLLRPVWRLLLLLRWLWRRTIDPGRTRPGPAADA